MKRHLVHVIQRLGLLGLADSVHYLMHRLAAIPANRRFVSQHPDFALPPPRLAFEAYGHTRWDEYRSTGLAHAELMAALVRQHTTGIDLAVLDWGCGAARIIRHMAEMGIANVSLTGVDVDPAALAWCRENLPGIRFVACAMRPPLPFDDASFDAVYHYSVWTHLSEASTEEWSAEMARVLKPGGVMIGTTHGDHYASLLLPREFRRYRAGQVVTRQGYAEGRKYYLSFCPPQYMRGVLGRNFPTLRHLTAGYDPHVPQDVWVAVKSGPQREAAAPAGGSIRRPSSTPINA